MTINKAAVHSTMQEPVSI